MLPPVYRLAGRLSLCAAHDNPYWLWDNPYMEVPHTNDGTAYSLLPKDFLHAVDVDSHGGHEELHDEQPIAHAAE